jgi:hypothetical protein
MISQLSSPRHFIGVLHSREVCNKQLPERHRHLQTQVQSETGEIFSILQFVAPSRS